MSGNAPPRAHPYVYTRFENEHSLREKKIITINTAFERIILSYVVRYSSKDEHFFIQLFRQLH